uniref:Uncharacterized protein n=1 Tax=Romanomermis culicivorax TaxID=13658 RepID=A0A915IQI8_ROMCU
MGCRRSDCRQETFGRTTASMIILLTKASPSDHRIFGAVVVHGPPPFEFQCYEKAQHQHSQIGQYDDHQRVTDVIDAGVGGEAFAVPDDHSVFDDRAKTTVYLLDGRAMWNKRSIMSRAAINIFMCLAVDHLRNCNGNDMHKYVSKLTATG